MNARNETLEQLKRAVLLRKIQQTKGALNGGSDEDSPLRPVSREQRLPLSFAQQRLWFLDQLDSNASVAYHVPFALRLRGRLNRPVLQATLDRVVARHESLRTRFVLVDGEPVQSFEPADAGFSLDVLDLRSLPEEARDAAISRLADTEARKRFDLSSGPLIRGKLLQLDELDHILLVTQHHIVCDGWSIGVLVREVSALYAAFSEGRPDPLPTLSIQYADYAAWQRQWLQGEVLRAQERFWRTQLQNAPQLLDLPTDRPRPDAQSFVGASVSIRLSTELSAGVRRVARQQGCTLFMVLLSGWSALLSRLSRQDDLVIGTPVANRQRREIEPLIGFFVNTLALRMQLRPDIRVAELLEQVKQAALQAYAHQDLPFEHIVEMLQPARSLGHSPIFQVGISLDNTRGDELTLPELTLSSIAYPQTTTQFDLYATLSDDGAAIAGSLIYSVDLFDSATIERIAGYFATLLTGMVADAQSEVFGLPLLTQTQREQLLTTFNDSAADFPLQHTVHQMIEARVSERPEAVALVYAGDAVNYDQLNRRANQVAHRLLELGVRPDDRVGICLERGIAMVVGLLGILKSGAAYVPLDPTYPGERLTYMLEDSAPAALLSQRSLCHHLPTSVAPLQLLDAAGCMEDLDAPRSQDNIDSRRLGLTPRHLAYVIYTSGSTGWPKGVMCEHRGLTNLALAQIEAFGIEPGSRVLQFASFSFDACVSETVITLCRGATLCLASYEDLMPGEPLLRVLSDARITCATLPPVALAALPAHSQLADLECLIVAGEACPPALAARWAQGRRFINAYGPTETTVCATIYSYSSARPGILPIGRPMANMRIYILDAHRQPVPLGVIGEIFIGGIGVARGYLHREELTAERFLEDPFTAAPEARMYRTGDLGRWLADGNVEYLGRHDTQVKLRGLRIELGEIESWLRQHHRVKDALVIAREDVPGDKRLVAYLRLERKVELWPSVSEFYVYDELLYHAMAAHETRNRCYAEAFGRHLPGKTVVEIGPGPHAVLARMAIAAGASKVYAIELLERSFQAASRKIRDLGLEDRIILIHGDATRVELPERADYCVSEIVGNIGGSEGAAVIINNARRFLKEPAHMIPERSLSRITAVALTEDLFEYAFSDTTRHYVEQIFSSTGGPFDLRVCVRDLPAGAILSTSDVFEDLDYTRTLAPESDHSITLHVEKAGVLTGFMIWMVLYVDAQNVLDTYQDQGSWLPVYFPVFADGVAVAVGDRIVATVARRVTQDLYPDFFVAGAIQHADGRTEPFAGSLPHRSQEYRGSPFYLRLFAHETIPVAPQVTPQSLRAHLLKKLPEYMVPSAFITLPAFPLTPNGKLDRRALPAPDSHAVPATDYEPPRGETELAIAAIWRDLLRLDRVGRRAHFFESGGHSLLAVRMLSRLRDVLGVDVSLRELFAHSRLDELAHIASQALQIERTPIPLAERSQPLPLSFAQQRLWFLDRLDRSAGAAYHLPAALRLQGPLQLEVLQAALDRVVARHEVLRTRFDLVGEAPVQVIAPAEVGFVLTMEDLSSDPPNAGQLRRLVEEEGRKPFDVAAGPLIRGRLLRLGAQEHVLLMTQHHIISDGWSIGILIREVSLLYGALSDGRADPLPPLPIQYADYAAWQRQWLQGEMLHRQVEFWRTQLEGSPALLELPTDRPRPAVQSYVGSAVPLRLSVELSGGLRRLASQQGCTLFMTLLAGWATLLSRLSNQEDVVIGTPVANRQRTQVESLIGLFVNTLALRVQVREPDTTATLLDQIKARTLAAYAHQDLPFEQVVEAVQPPRSLAYSPIFQVGLSLDNTPAEDLRLAGLTLSTIDLPSSTTQLDLFLSLRDDGQTIGGELTYVSTLFEAASAARIAGYFTTLLAAMAADAQQPVHTLPLLSAAQRERILRGYNGPAVVYPERQTLPHAFEEQAAIRPNAIALICKGEHLSYDQLNRRANSIAQRLAAMGVRPDQRVAICVERNVGMVVGLLGILKAGAAYVPMDPRYPAERLRYMLDDSTPVALLTQAHLRGQLPQTDVPLVLLDEISAIEPDDNLEPPAAQLSSGNLAYVIYTSGSTGQPKGVMVEHRSVVSFLASMAEAPGIASGDALLAVTTLSFDIAGLEIFLPLSYGAKLVLAGSDEVADPAWLQKAIREHDITVMQATPATWRLLLAAGWPGAATLKALCGGEALPTDLSAQLRARVGALWNLYGPTETTIWSARGRVDTDSVASGPYEPIGRPIANTRIHVLDSRLQPVPVGVTGEIHIGGAGVARGYLNREDLTAERFIRDPFSADSHERLYKTGDLGRYQTDGTLEYLGRNDFQVKIRGFRIELGEIEARLNECSGVRQSVVTARDDRLVAYLLTEAGIELEPAALREALTNSLADYMLPSAFVTLREFPLTPNGKVDRRALPAPESDASVMRGHEPAQGEIEVCVARIWQDLLGLRSVGRHDRFFELGGHSLLAVQLLSRLQQQLGVDLSLRELFTHSSLRDLSILVGESRRSNLPPIATADRSRALPLSFAQQRLWFLEKLGHAADAAYYMPAALRLVGPLDVDALRASLDRLVARHESLRTTFAMVDGEPVQVIAPAGSRFTLTAADLCELPEAERDAAAQQIAAAEMQASFDLSVGPLIRGKLLQLGAQEHVLLVNQHHIISDGWSINLLVREVSALYAAFAAGVPDPLPEPRIQYADYAVWQRQWLQGEVLDAQTRYWKTQLEGVPALLELPTDRPRPAVQSFVGGIVPLALSEELSARLRELSQRHGCTLFMTLFAGWSALLSRLSRQDDVVIGVSIANRQRVEVESLIGLFVNTLALRVRFDTGLSVAALLEQVKGTALAAYMHQDLPFEQVVDAVQPPRTLSHSPVYQAGMSVDNVPRGDLLLPNLQVSMLQQEQTTTQFDLFLSLSDDGATISGQLEYSDALFDVSTIERWGDHLRTLLAAMAADPSQAVRGLPLLTAGQRHRLLSDFNATQRSHPAGQVLPELFARQARQRPQAIALICEGAALSYDELNRRANRVAHHLLGWGVRPDDRVAVCTERSLAMLVGLLGILKAGAAYVPLDPAYPGERLAYMVRDSAPRVLLLQAGVDLTLCGTAVPTLLLEADGQSPVLESQPDSDPDLTAVGLTERHLAYLIYTSGSAGQSKGVMIEHRSAVNFWRVMGESTHRYCTVRARVALNAAFSFDMSLKGILQLLSGRTLILIPQSIRASGPDLLEFLARQRVDAFDSTPSQLEGLLSAGLLERDDYAPVSVLLGGEPIKTPMWSRLQQCARTSFYNMYGPTECTVDATIGQIQELGERPSIGRVIGNTRVYILDEQLEPVPIGVPGEIHIGGVQVARGYWQRAALTAERFIHDPYSDELCGRMYKSGDLGRYRADGCIEYLGRNDLQVKIRGFRIEPGEIEAQLQACAGVREAVVLTRAQQDDPAELRLVAYIVVDEGASLSVEALRQQLGMSLPDYMLPGAFVRMTQLPLTPNGKVDRRALPEPLDRQSRVSRGYEAPRGEIEVAIAQIWRGLLKMEQIGRHDDFFMSGGHSLMGVQLLTRLHKTFGVKIGIRQLFAQPTVAALARSVVASTRAPLPPIELADRTQPLLLSFAQQRLWFLDRLDPAAGAAYHMPAALRLRGRLHRDALQVALNRIVARHEILRTHFGLVGEEPVQVIEPADVGFPLALHDLTHLSGSQEQASVVTRLSEAEARAPFELSQGPLIRGQLLRLAERDHVLLITQHHIISDGWSIGLLVEEFCSLYVAFSEARSDPLPAPALQYADYAMWQRRWLDGEVLQTQIAFWKQQLQGAPVLLALPTTYPRPAVQSYGGRTVPVELPVALSAGLRKLGQQNGCTLFMTLFAGWAALLSRLSGQVEVVIGTPVANRQRHEVESLLGFFANTLALRVRLDEVAAMTELLRQVKRSLLAAYAHQELPFEQVVEILQPQRSLGHSPIFQVMLNINNTPGGELTLPELELSTLPQEQATTQFDLSLSLVDNGATIVGELKYAGDLFDAPAARRILEQLCVLLSAMVADASRSIGELCAFLPAMPAPAPAEVPLAPAASRPPYEAPRGRCEVAIAAVWAELLEREPIGRQDDFFALGGVSLMAVRMLSRLRKSYGLQVTLRELFTHPRLAEFARLFETDEERQPTQTSNLVAVRPLGSELPLYFVHPVGGEIQYVHELAKWLEARIPVYGLAATGLAPGETPVRRLPEMAARYIQAIRGVQAQGPYRLAGWSAGGMVAYEMARQLRDDGHDVEFVGLLDTASDYWRRRPADGDAAAGWTEANYLLSWLPESLPQQQRQRFEQLAAANDVDAMLRLAIAHHLLPPGLPRELEADMLRAYLGVAYATQEALLEYVPVSIDTPVSLFAAAGETRIDATLGWRPLLGERLVLMPTPGTHMTMLEWPHIGELSRALSDALGAVTLQSNRWS